MRNSENTRGHPTQSLFDTSADVRHGIPIFDVWEPFGTTDVVDFKLSLFLDGWVQNHGLDEAIERGCCRIRPSLMERTDDISRQVVGEAIALLTFGNTDAETRLLNVNLLCLIRQ